MAKVRVIESKFLEDGSGKKYFEFAGSSAATKPVNRMICSGSFFIEVDTGKAYIYNEDADAGEEWYEMGGDE